MTDMTVVTACDSPFVWGAMLLGMSMRYHGMDCYYHVLGYGLTEDDLSCLESIPNTKVFPAQRSDARSVCTLKPLALATASTEYIIWMDADCIVTGNLEPMFHCPEGTMQIRFRESEENASVYRNYYSRKDAWGSIPSKVLEIWRKDVADLDSPRIKTVCQTNCFVIRRSSMPFIKLWKSQMEKVIPWDLKTVYAHDSVAYSMTDESVINSLFAFSTQAPGHYDYLMDKDPTASCIHFGLSPKPWVEWTMQSFRYYDEVQKLLHWAKGCGITLPEMPKSFLPQNRKRSLGIASRTAYWKAVRYKISSLGRTLLRNLKS